MKNKFENNKPLVSVLLPVYNSEKYLRHSIESILNQTYDNFELILINDGSSDGSQIIIKEINDPRLVVLEFEENKGIVEALNYGMDACKGKYIARMDSDDIAVIDRLEKQVNFLETHPEYVVVGGQARIFGESDRLYEVPTDLGIINVALYFENPLVHPTIMMRRKVLHENQLKYHKELKHLEDWGLWLELSKKGKIGNLQDVLVNYRFEGQNITAKNKNTLKERVMILYQKYLPEIYPDLSEKQLENHWNISRSVVDGLTVDEIIKLQNTIHESLVKYGFNTNDISKYLSSKSEKIYFKLCDRNKKEGVRFLRKKGDFSFSKLRYLLSTLSK